MDTDGRTGERPNRRRWTTIVLEQAHGKWRATQEGVPVEGRGETAARAAANYCRRIEEGGEADD